MLQRAYAGTGMRTIILASGFSKPPASSSLYHSAAVHVVMPLGRRSTTRKSCAVRKLCAGGFCVYVHLYQNHDTYPLHVLCAVLESSTTGRLWDEDSASPYFSFATGDGDVVQVRYDDPDSLRLKFSMAAELGLRGVGVWHLDALPSGPDAASQRQKVAMWRAFAAFAQPTAVA